jgi:endonuclease/exonuclease/phosphatase family metal-dependent hydrolase
MARFSVLSWNVENFIVANKDVNRIVQHVRGYNPDVFALLEVVGAGVYQNIATRFPGYTFHITYGRQSQEILVGVRNTLSAFFAQKTEFRSGNAYLRPGALITLTFGNTPYNLLFLHTKSTNQPVGLGLRDDMFKRAFRLKRRLDTLTNNNARFIFCGDLNTMGMSYPYNSEIDYDTELRKLRRDARRVGMDILDKSHNGTWTDEDQHLPDSNLDHVVASDSVSVTRWMFPNGAEGEVEVKGWNDFANGSAAWRSFVNRVSDHCSLYFEVE